MTQRQIMTDSARSLLRARFEQTRQLATIPKQIAEAMQEIESRTDLLPEKVSEAIRQMQHQSDAIMSQIERSALDMAAAAEAMAALSKTSAVEIKRREEYLATLDGQIKTQIGALKDQAKGLRQAAADRQWTTFEMISLVIGVAALAAGLSMALSIIFLH